MFSLLFERASGGRKEAGGRPPLRLNHRGELAVIWSDVSETYNDIWVSFYQPDHDTWSLPRQLTFDNNAESYVRAVLDAGGDLVAIYNKVETIFEDQWETIGDQAILLEGMPRGGQSDLYYLVQSFAVDLAVDVEDLNIAPPNPLPGGSARISARIRNLGESPAEGIKVGFYEGDPDAGGVQIGLAEFDGILVGGGDGEVSTDWVVPESTGEILVHVRIDPEESLLDRNRNNNSSSIPALVPDLTIRGIQVQEVGRSRIFTIRVADEGSLAAGNVELALRRDALGGSLLKSFTVPDLIVPGAYLDEAWMWEDVTQEPEELVEVFAIVDEGEAIDEFDEENNVSSTTVSISTGDEGKPLFWRGEVNGDGILNIADPIHIIHYLFSDAVVTCADAVDANDDGDTDLTDPMMLLTYLFLEGSLPADPFFECGVDPTSDELTCDSFALCE